MFTVLHFQLRCAVYYTCMHMKRVTLLAVSVFTFFPLVTHAQTLQAFFKNLLLFFNNVLIPFLLGIAFLIFIINVIRYFIFGSTSQEGQEKARALAMYSVFALVLIIIFWGIIAILAKSTGLSGESAPTPDYITG